MHWHASLFVAPIGLVGAITKALCCAFSNYNNPLIVWTFRADINRITNSGSSSSERTEEVAMFPDPRILIISISPDQSPSYIPIMNAIFSAQKLVRWLLSHRGARSHDSSQKVTIDVCKLLGDDSVFLQQAAHLTGGSYIHVERPDGLLQYLMVRTSENLIFILHSSYII